jgi:MoxR-like ATPase
MTTVSIKRGPAANDLNSFLMDVQYIKGVGRGRAETIFVGTTLTFNIAPEAHDATLRKLRRLALDGTLIVEGLPGVAAAPEPVAAPQPVAAPEPVAAPGPAAAQDALAILRDLLASGVTEARVLELIASHGGRPAHVTLDLTAPGVTLSGTEMMHHRLPLLASAVAASVNVMLVGPAGSGKTTAAKQAARMLGLPFYGTGALSSEYKLSGFIDAQGRVISTAFRKAFETGGVFLFDEVDASLPSALLAFNSALANDWMDFPDGCVERHPDFRVIAGANTYGTGADRQYVGRNQLDAASLDRYAVLDWGYDEALEAAMLGLPAPKGSPVPASINPLADIEIPAVAGRWSERVRKVRHAVGELKVRHVVSPRATVNGARLLAAGWSWADAEDAVIWKGLDADTKGKVTAKAA